MKLAQPVFVALAAASVLGAAKAFGGQSECAKDNTDLLLTIAANVEALTARVETLADGQKALADRVEGLEGGLSGLEVEVVDGRNALLAEVRWGYPAHASVFGPVTAFGNYGFPTDGDIQWPSVAVSASGRVLAAVSHVHQGLTSARPGDIWLSRDAGKTWTGQDQLKGDWTDITCDNSGSKFAAVGEDSGDYRIVTKVAGGTWVEVDPSQTGTNGVQWKEVAMSGDGTTLYAGTWAAGSDPGIWKAVYSEAEGIWTNWTQAPPPAGMGWNVRYNYIGDIAVSVDGKKCVAGTRKGFVITSSNSGNTWLLRGPENGLSRLTGGGMVGASYDGVASSSDGEVLALITSMGGGGGEEQRIWMSHDSGETWTPRGPRHGPWQAIASSADGMKLVAAANCCPLDGPMVWTSTDSGLTWSQASGTEPMGPAYWLSIASSADGKTLVAGSRSDGIWTSPPFVPYYY